jgi:hypothetical protein
MKEYHSHLHQIVEEIAMEIKRRERIIEGHQKRIAYLANVAGRIVFSN